MTRQQQYDTVQRLQKYEWLMSLILKNGNFSGHLGTDAINELNDCHVVIYNTAKDTSCGTCRGDMIRNVGQWYEKNKSILDEKLSND